MMRDQINGIFGEVLQVNNVTATINKTQLEMLDNN